MTTVARQRGRLIPDRRSDAATQPVAPGVHAACLVAHPGWLVILARRYADQQNFRGQAVSVGRVFDFLGDGVAFRALERTPVAALQVHLVGAHAQRGRVDVTHGVFGRCVVV